MNHSSLCAVLLVFLLSPSVDDAQKPSAISDANGTVTGRVIASDTQQPVRFADVLIYAKPREIATNDMRKDEKDSKKVQTTLQQIRAGVEVYQTKTNRDGIFVAEHVVAGDYFVFASASGYLQPSSMFQAAYSDSTDPKVIDQMLHLIHVSVAGISQANVVLQRGAAVSGTIRYDDGTPVQDAAVSLIQTKNQAELPDGVYSMLAASVAPDEGLQGMSDDRGRFRIAGVPDGRYIVQSAVVTHTAATVHAGKLDRSSLDADYPLMVYAPKSFHRADAVELDLRAPEEHVDEDLIVNLSKLYSIAGQVVSAADHQGIGAGTVWLSDTGDKTFARSTELDPQGNFLLNFVPEGTYGIGVDASAGALVLHPGNAVVEVDGVAVSAPPHAPS